MHAYYNSSRQLVVLSRVVHMKRPNPSPGVKKAGKADTIEVAETNDSCLPDKEDPARLGG